MVGKSNESCDNGQKIFREFLRVTPKMLIGPLAPLTISDVQNDQK